MLLLAPHCNFDIHGYVQHPYPMVRGPQVRSWSFVDLDAFRSTSPGQRGKKNRIKRVRNTRLTGTINSRRLLAVYLGLKCSWFGDLFFPRHKVDKTVHLSLSPGTTVTIRIIDWGFLYHISFFFAGQCSRILMSGTTVSQRTSVKHTFSLLGQIPEMPLMNQAL